MYSMSCVPQDMRTAAAELESGEAAPNPWAALDRERNRNRLENAGGIEAYLASPQNTWDKAREVAKRDDMPKMYFSCGTADFVMYRHFKAFRAYAQEIGLKAEFTESEGYNHEWRFWEKEIRRAIEFFLPGDEKAGNAF
jgi:S-formylglutathione hydrolase FrmB